MFLSWHVHELCLIPAPPPSPPGHSLGAGVAALLTLMVRHGFGPSPRPCPFGPRVYCVGLACPPTASLHVARSCEDYMVVLVSKACEHAALPAVQLVGRVLWLGVGARWNVGACRYTQLRGLHDGGASESTLAVYACYGTHVCECVLGRRG